MGDRLRPKRVIGFDRNTHHRAEQKRIELAGTIRIPTATFIADGDRCNEAADVVRSHRHTGEDDGALPQISYLDPSRGDSTLVRVKGTEWIAAFDRASVFHRLPQGGLKDPVSSPLFSFLQDYVQFYNATARRGQAWSMHGQCSTFGDHFSVDAQDGANMVARLVLLATLDDYRPIVMAARFRGEIEDVERQSGSWLRKNQTAIEPDGQRP